MNTRFAFCRFQERSHAEHAYTTPGGIKVCGRCGLPLPLQYQPAGVNRETLLTFARLSYDEQGKQKGE